MKNEIVIETVKEQHVLSIRLRINLENLGEAFNTCYGKVLEYMSEIGAEPSGPPFGVYYNHDMQDLDTEIGFPVSKPLPGRGEIAANTFPEMKAATYVFNGTYDDLSKGYEVIYGWIAQNNYEISGAHYDFYLNDPDTTPANELATKIIIPIK